MTFPENTLLPFPLRDGIIVESVFYGSGTLCVSSQAGCAVRCPFCASGSRGLLRNLSVEEMIGQVDAARGAAFPPARVTISGIGEPLHNPRVVREFIDWCRRQQLPVSLTTTGAPLRMLEDFIHGPDNGLMVSLHAGTPSVHRRLVPKGPDYDEFWTFLGSVWPFLSGRRRRRIGINYLLLGGVNDGDEEISHFTERLSHFPETTVHLLTLNHVRGSEFSIPSADRVHQIHRTLAAEGINVRRANRWRQVRYGGCGTLMWQTAGTETCGKVPPEMP